MTTATPMIAIVDDDVSVCTGLQRLLRSTGLTATTFTSGPAFLVSLETAVPDCVVLDIRMPGMTGFEVQSQLRATGFTFPVIFISAEERVDPAAGPIPSGAFAFLSKPFDGEVLVEIISAALRHTARG